ncbi:phosphoglycerate mutase family protein [Corynebacterium atypicum]|uniref:phosphoglycerate mutase family protein n=1 Tax=Corynebacterium atypicum TaxID=191610 RepID=UPI00068A485B|nr:phosphoglycerate mutase family protein [Corynebacterium atypicum]
MAGRIILVRHGQTGSNVRRVIDTRPPGAELSPLGRRQAEAAGRELAEVSGARLAGMWCSVALRAQQTAVLAQAAFGAAFSLADAASGDAAARRSARPGAAGSPEIRPCRWR